MIMSVATPTVPLRYLVASIAAHGILAATPMGVPAPLPDQSAPLVLRVDMRSAARTVPDPAPAAAPRRAVRAERPAQRRMEQQAAHLAVVAPPIPAALEALPDESPIEVPASPSPLPAAEPPMQIARAASTLDLAPLRSGPSDFHLLSPYTRELGEHVNRARHYPPLARVRNWQGTTVLDVSVGASGEVVALSIANSSGFDILDQQAMRMVTDSQPLPPPSAAVEFLPLRVQLPVTFSLR